MNKRKIFTALTLMLDSSYADSFSIARFQSLTVYSCLDILRENNFYFWHYVHYDYMYICKGIYLLTNSFFSRYIILKHNINDTWLINIIIGGIRSEFTLRFFSLMNRSCMKEILCKRILINIPPSVTLHYEIRDLLRDIAVISRDIKIYSARTKSQADQIFLTSQH